MTDYKTLAREAVERGTVMRYTETGAPYMAYATDIGGVDYTVDAALVAATLRNDTRAPQRGGAKREATDVVAELFAMLADAE